LAPPRFDHETRASYRTASEGAKRMERYDFEIVSDRERIVLERGVELADQSALWRRIARIARRIGRPGSLIRVSNAEGVVVLVGVATALQLCADLLNSLPPL
jgi:hypothetical protein